VVEDVMTSMTNRKAMKQNNFFILKQFFAYTNAFGCFALLLVVAVSGLPARFHFTILHMVHQ
jgi:hypothetical protein